MPYSTSSEWTHNAPSTNPSPFPWLQEKATAEPVERTLSLAISFESEGSARSSLEYEPDFDDEDYRRRYYHSANDRRSLDRRNVGLSRASSTAAAAVGGVVSSSLRRNGTNSRSVKSNRTLTDPAFEVDFEEGEAGNPRNWPLWYKSLMIFALCLASTCVVAYSTSYTSAIPGIDVAFGIKQSTGILGVTTYLLGLAAGSLVLAPLSEMYGRRPIYVISFGLFVVLIIPCALATNFATIAAVRFIGAFCAAAVVSNAAGTINDVIDEKYRALAFSIWSIGPMNGPVIGPVIGGFVEQYLGWRWTFWIIFILGAVAWVLLASVKETYAPALLRQRTIRKRKETDDKRWWSRYDEKSTFWPLLRVNLSRPFILTFTEPICIFWDIYVSLVYGCLYLCFVAYPIVFQDLRGWSAGLSGLAFCGIGVGSMVTIGCEPLIRRWIRSHKPDPMSGKPPPEAMVRPILVASVLIPIGQLWFAWTCTPNVHWIVPILAGIPFGAGNTAVFIYASAYLVNSYQRYAASALAGNSVLRSVMGATLPLAGAVMYDHLDPNWAGTLLGLLVTCFIPIPFVFYRYGAKIRSKSALIRQMRQDRDRMENKKKAAAAEQARQREVLEKAAVALEPISEDADLEANFAATSASSPTLVDPRSRASVVYVQKSAGYVESEKQWPWLQNELPGSPPASSSSYGEDSSIGRPRRATSDLSSIDGTRRGSPETLFVHRAAQRSLDRGAINTNDLISMIRTADRPSMSTDDLISMIDRYRSSSGN